MFLGKKYIIFDMDGTLIDSVGVWNEVDRLLIEKLMGTKAAEDVGELQRSMSLRLSEREIQKLRDDVLRQYRDTPDPYGEYCRVLKERYGFREAPQEIIKIRYDIAQEYLKNAVDYKAGAPAFLKGLRDAGMTLAIASTTKRNNMDVYRMENTNIRSKAPIDAYFSLVYTREDVREIKPEPEVYVKAMKTLGAKPAECLVFEDSLVGVEAAKAAGIEVAVIYDRYSDEDRAAILKLADYDIRDFDAAMEALEKFLINEK